MIKRYIKIDYYYIFPYIPLPFCDNLFSFCLLFLWVSLAHLGRMVIIGFVSGYAEGTNAEGCNAATPYLSKRQTMLVSSYRKIDKNQIGKCYMCLILRH